MRKNRKLLFSALLFFISLQVIAQQTRDGVVEIKNEEGKVTAKETYEEGVLQGWSKYFYEDTVAVKYAGNYKDGKKSGRWLYYHYPDGEQVVYQYYTYQNGDLNGKFREVNGDTIIIGKFQEGKLDSTFLSFKMEISSGGDTLEIPLKKGRYKNGQKVGSWKIFNNGQLYKEGMYRDGKKDMLWKTYDVFTNSSSESDLMKETHYKKGVKDGKELVYFEIDSQKVDCKGEKHPPCYEYSRRERYMEAYYHKGELNGDYLVKGVAGVILEKGEYDHGKKIGNWIERKPGENRIEEISYFDGKKMGPVEYKDFDGTVRMKGNYVENKKNGKWIYFNESGKKVKEMVYDMDVLDGDVVIYNNSGVKKKVREYEKGKLVNVLRYDFSGNEVEKSYKLEYDTPGEGALTVKYMYKRPDSTIYANYVYSPEGEINPENFENNFLAALKNGKPYLHGSYEKMVNNKLQVSGIYTQGKKDGIWEYYYNDGITWQKKFDKGELSGEKFINTATGKPVDKADYIVKYPNGKLKWEWEIKDGVRHGKSLYYNRKGEEVEKVKYKEGQPK